MKRVLAISGGMDSMVLLDFCVKKYGKDEIAVAHFNHGTRPSADDDEKFVKKVAEKYGVLVEVGRGKLGEGVSEEKAREKRYEFLRQVAKKYDAKILTAHHLDDLCESVAINFLRGTGWRGLAVLNAKDVERPLVSWTKKNILEYAAKNGIVFREDPTNSDEKYLRNRIRLKIRGLPDEKKTEVGELSSKQKEIEREIEKILDEILPKDGKFGRKWFSQVDDEVGMEILRTRVTATRPQMLNFLKAIREYQPGKSFNLPKDKLVKIDKDSFVI